MPYDITHNKTCKLASALGSVSELTKMKIAKQMNNMERSSLNRPLGKFM